MKDVSKQIRGAHPHTRGRRMTTSAVAINGSDGSFRGGLKTAAPIGRMSIPRRIARRKFRAVVVVLVFFFFFPPARVCVSEKNEREREPGSPLRTGGYQRRKRTRRDQCMMWIGGGRHLKSRVATQLLSRASKHRARTNTRIAAGTLARGAIK